MPGLAAARNIGGPVSAWEGFRKGLWQKEIDVRDAIQQNYDLLKSGLYIEAIAATIIILIILAGIVAELPAAIEKNRVETWKPDRTWPKLRHAIALILKELRSE